MAVTGAGTVISLCDLTGVMVAPWISAGYDALIVDPQHGVTRQEHGVTKFAGTVEDSLPTISRLMRTDTIVAVFSFPPCTDMATSGARWFAQKYLHDNLFQARAVMVAEQCRIIGRLSGAPWFVENPISILSNVFGRPNFYFHPYHFTGWAREDNYTKRTSLWTGGGFVMPAERRDESLPAPDDRIHKAAPGAGRANMRAATPAGFARAVFAANSAPARWIPTGA